ISSKKTLARRTCWRSSASWRMDSSMRWLSIIAVAAPAQAVVHRGQAALQTQHKFSQLAAQRVGLGGIFGRGIHSGHQARVVAVDHLLQELIPPAALFQHLERHL